MSEPLSDQVRRFVDGLSHATIATLDADGSVHQAVVWFMRDGDELVVNSAAGRRWPANLRRDPRASLVVANEAGDWVGFRGTVDVVDDPERGQADIAELARRFDPAGADERIRLFRTQSRITFRLAPERIHVEIEE
jgi:PPOX class probable F420-dependent enzyme